MYIRATGNISAQKTFGKVSFLTEPVISSGGRLNCIEPDYKDIIDPKMIRRMSRIIRMGVAAASACLHEAGIKVPDAIITGTAYGCLQDTEVFLTKMVEQHEELLTPTAFIQSTHNTIGAQIGLMLKCNNYNNTFVHRGFSFESALLDGIMLVRENRVSNFLVGAIDELTDSSFTILSRFGLYKQAPAAGKELSKDFSKGTIAGEGAAFFFMSKNISESDYAKLDALHSFYKPKDSEETEQRIMDFLKRNSMNVEDADLIITGRNADKKNDAVYDSLQDTLFKNSLLANYKHLSGEYPTSMAFALWLAANILKTGKIPAALNVDNAGRMIKKILIYNHYQNIHHSLLLLSAC